MKAEELRIGNWIQDFECEPYYFKVEQISRYVGYELWVHYRNGSAKAKDPEPILLTEEWLLKFGFVKDNYGTFYIKDFDNDKNWLWLKTQEDGIGVALNLFNEKPITYLNTIYHVHQLQNLYFALTGEELTIKTK